MKRKNYKLEGKLKSQNYKLEEKLKSHNDTYTIGTFKSKKSRDDFYNHYKRIGGFSVTLLKEFLDKFDTESQSVIGFYIDSKGNLAPAHCHKHIICPRENVETETIFEE